MIKQIFDFLAAYEQPVYLVGGSLRQWLLDKPVKDYDFVVSKNASKLAFQLANKFRLDCFPLDRERDMARIVLGDLYLDFAPYGNDLEADLKARDLTINAMACPVDVGLLSGDTNLVISQLIDPCAGLADLKLGLVRGVSSENFLSDPLRMLRVYRFAASLKFKIDVETQRWVGEHAQCLNTVAMERMLQELLSILLCPDSAQWLEQLKQQKLLEHLLPLEVDTLQLKEFEDMSTGFLNGVLSQYLMSPLAAQRPRLFAFKIGLLIIKSIPSRGQSSIQNKLENLTLSRKETESLIRWQNLIPNLLEIFEQDSAIKRFHLFRHAQEDFLGLFLFAKLWINCGYILGSQELLDQLLEQWLDPNNQIAHPLQWLDGHELIKTLKIRPGPLLGQILLSLQEAQACGKLGDKSEAIKYAQNLAQTLGANNCE